MNHLATVTTLKNRYFALRHGESEANVAGIILSNPENGIDAYGLTQNGKEQVRKSLSEDTLLDKETLIYSSDFKRASETAQIVKEQLHTEQVHLTSNLRERYFGDFENTTNENYNSVWDNDAQDPNHTKDNVESVNAVLERTTKLIDELETQYEGKNIVLVAHGDSLQILQTGFAKVSPATHRSLEHLTTAQLRELRIAE